MLFNFKKTRTRLRYVMLLNKHEEILTKLATTKKGEKQGGLLSFMPLTTKFESSYKEFIKECVTVQNNNKTILKDILESNKSEIIDRLINELKL